MNIVKMILKYITLASAIAFSFLLGLFLFFNFPVGEQKGESELGVTFSSRYSADIGLDWKENFLAVLDELGVKKVRIPVYWDLVEKRQGEYDYSDVDWQLQEAAKRDAEVILTIGQKVPRWPECFIPDWAEKDDQLRKRSLLNFMSKTVERYKNGHPEIKYWQVENEPFLKFGVCPALDKELLDSEIALVRMSDPSRKIIITDSGELSLWYQAAKRADIFGTTMYRTIFKEGFGYFEYPIGPRFFHFKYFINKILAKQDKAIVIELQAEPWISGWTIHGTLEEQFRSMNSEKLKENVEFAQKSGFREIYLWGAEWWYWLKTDQNRPELWNTAKQLFSYGQKTSARFAIGGESESRSEISEGKIEKMSEASEIPEKMKIEVPFTAQAPFGNWDPIHEEACEEASLIMLKYFLDKKDLSPAVSEKEIQEMVEFEKKNYGKFEDSTAEEMRRLFMDFYGLPPGRKLSVFYDFGKEDIKKYLAKGNPVIIPAAGRKLGNPYFTPPGPLYHALVLTGYDGNNIIANDPGTRRGGDYLYNEDVIFEAIHDFTGKKEDIEWGRKAMIVLE